MKHGFISGYLNHKCRCEACRKAWSGYMREYRRKQHEKLLLGLAEPEHGTLNTYGNYRCRCAACRAARSQATVTNPLPAPLYNSPEEG